MNKVFSSFIFAVFCSYTAVAQLPVARDTITVIENGYVLKMPWGNGINYANVSSLDLNLDGKKDIVVFDRYNNYSEGRFRCFINTGVSGSVVYKADANMSYQFPKAYNWAILMDYDGDGKEDIFTAGNSNVMVYRNISTSALTPSFTLVKQVILTDISTSSTPFYTPLFVSVIGVPGIADVDNDGDLDILTFSAQGTFVEFHKNMSIEKYGSADSLVYKYSSDCWGNVAESSCTVDFSLCTNGSRNVAKITGDPNHKELHAGSCLTCLDNDGDGDKDLLMGDVACNKIQYVHNNGTPTNASFNDTTKVYPNYQSNNTTPIRMNSFPCAYYLDVDGDNKKDLVASPNSYGSENFKSMWYYKNTSTTNTVNFMYVKSNLMQDEMIEVGQNSFPVLFDYDCDGKKDLLIGTYGYYITNSLSPRLTLYRNIGTASQPSYSLVSKDYAGLSAQSGVYLAMPAVGDIDGDGDVDICIGTSSGQIHWLKNSAGAGNISNFSTFLSSPFQFTTASAVAAPQLFDLDGDGLLDLLIGTKNGKIAYYQNVGTSTAPSFSLITNFLGNVQVGDDPNVYGSDGFAVPFFYKENGTTKLLVGSVSGKVYQYTVPANVLSLFNLVSSLVNNLYEGGQSAVWYEDVNNDGKRDLFVGNASGGLSFFSSASPYVGIDSWDGNPANAVNIFPNPANDKLTVIFSSTYFQKAKIQVVDLPGKILLSEELSGPDSRGLDLSHLGKGIYFMKISLQAANGQQTEITKKIIKE